MNNKNVRSFLRNGRSLCERRIKLLLFVLILLGIYFYATSFGLYKIERTSIFNETNIYIDDDEPFQRFVDEVYDEQDLVEWKLAPRLRSDPNKPGDLGKPVKIPQELTKWASKQYEKYKLNVVASEMIMVNRTLIDYRHKQCLTKPYPKKLPQTSVIIVFHNEEFFTLTRTIWSVYTTSPRALLKEIVLVDDKSEFAETGSDLDDYIKAIPVPVVIVRLPKRSGLTQAKLAGAQAATGTVITFIDAHCECGDGWLEPLLARITENRRAAVTPVCGAIDPDSFEVKNDLDYVYMGAFDWRGWFTWLGIAHDQEKKLKTDKTATIDHPTMVGGLFAVDREYFFKIGAYDDEMIYYGGENVELSIRLWSCGGSVEMAMCSRVYHIQKNSKPYRTNGGLTGTFMTNTARVVDVWFDDYKKIFYALEPIALSLRTDVSKRLLLRKQLKCKSFSWFLRKAYPESAYNQNITMIGVIENIGFPSRCLDTSGRAQPGPIGVEYCHAEGGNQILMVTKNDEIRIDMACLDAASINTPVKVYPCHMNRGNQQFTYDEQTNTFEHWVKGNCLTLRPDFNVVVSPCNGSLTQKWILRDTRLKLDL